MTITTYTDREIALRQQLATMTATATEYQQAANKMAWDYKVVDALRQQLSEAQAKNESLRKAYGDDRARGALEMAAKVCDEHLLYPSLTPKHCADHIRALAKEIK